MFSDPILSPSENRIHFKGAQWNKNFQNVDSLEHKWASRVAALIKAS